MTSRRLVIVLAAGCAVSAAAGTAPALAGTGAGPAARVVAERRIDARTLDLTVSSPAVGQRVKVRLITPRGWSRTAKRTWPVLYALHGGRDGYQSWTRSTDIERLAARYDVMVVMPDAGYNASYTNWFNYGRRGKPRWETFHTGELRRLVESRYRGGTRRAVMGLSSGGYGALSYSARNPGMFRYAASFSGPARISQRRMQTSALATVFASGNGVDPLRIWGVPGVHDANWRAHDPYERAAGLRGTRVHLSSGTTGKRGPLDRDLTPEQELVSRFVGGDQERLIGRSNMDLARRLRSLGVRVTTHFYGDGWHQWRYWQREMHSIWPAMMSAIGARRTG
ncbi:esterase family protein [Bailinhaonella thermotolerans]|uniref:Acyl-CoA:diacylglycerol acyltransferase n=2 Tax=Bailinhaonella thermotolerans TaxID=1070861 RepID=A0A3A4AT34_9ACTN|nr:esterase family protein [Bailinhaonella thermotolerans]